jgi:hypothetical protein
MDSRGNAAANGQPYLKLPQGMEVSAQGAVYQIQPAAAFPMRERSQLSPLKVYKFISHAQSSPVGEIRNRLWTAISFG